MADNLTAIRKGFFNQKNSIMEELQILRKKWSSNKDPEIKQLIDGSEELLRECNQSLATIDAMMKDTSSKSTLKG